MPDDIKKIVLLASEKRDEGETFCYVIKHVLGI
jgi:hypothetical protein